MTLSALTHSPVRWRDLRSLALPAFCAFLALLILLALGAWQIQRLHWKEGILARISAAEAAPPVPLQGTPGPFEKVEVTGRFRPDEAALFGAIVGTTPQGDRMGGDLIVPLERTDGPPVLVDRGWVPDPIPADVTWPTGDAHVSGYVLAPQTPGIFTPAPDASAQAVLCARPGCDRGGAGIENGGALYADRDGAGRVRTLSGAGYTFAASAERSFPVCPDMVRPGGSIGLGVRLLGLYEAAE